MYFIVLFIFIQMLGSLQCSNIINAVWTERLFSQVAVEYFQHGELDITGVFSPCSCWQAWLRFGKLCTEPL